jgi:glyoxylase-like metal-dependent hydrolase (beta-lactamase superfamily II)
VSVYSRVLTSLIALVFGLVAPAPAAQPHVADPPSLIAPYDVVKIADGVYGFMWRDPLADPIQGDALFVINDSDVVVVDTALLPSTARVMAAELRKLTPKPVRYVINTHWHDDHHGGNAVYRELWPDVRIVGHRETRSDIIEKTYRVRPKMLSDTLAAADRYERWAASGKDDEGKVLDERRRTRAGEIAVLDRAIVPELRAIQEAPPDVTFTDQLVLYRGGRTIEVRWLGLGNTRGDTVVVLPRERIAASGDLVVHPIPFMFGSYHEEWVKTLDALDGLPVDTFLPGHGPLLRDRTYLRQVRGLLRALVDRVTAAVAAGATLEQTQQQVTLQDWRATLAGDDPRKQRAFDGFVLQPAVERMWRQARGEPDK